jgi:ELWxxDGT repeat protein
MMLRRISRGLAPFALAGVVLLGGTSAVAGAPVLVKDIRPGTRPSFGVVDTLTQGTAVVNGHAVFYDHSYETGDPFGLWASDGTPAGTILLSSNSAIGNGIVSNGVLYTSGDLSSDGFELARTDGTVAGTYELKDINPGPPGSTPQLLADVGGTIFFNAYDVVHGSELWKTDGTTAGTVLVKDIAPGVANSGGTGAALTVGGTLYFTANDGTNGTELWKSDGTTAGTVMVADINPGPGSSSPHAFVDLGGTLFFLADDGTHFDELWRSDGTAAGTMLVKDIGQPFGICGQISCYGTVLHVLGGELVFFANDGTDGYEVWSSDGTAAGTMLVKDINPGAASSVVGDFAIGVPGVLLFGATDGTSGVELWRTDGTTAGTSMVKDINPGAGDSEPICFAAIGGSVFFPANDGTHGNELWITDGTAIGTMLVEDINPGSGDGVPLNPFCADATDIGGKLLFAADDGVHGQEPWISDGTSAGTLLLQDVRPGSAGGWNNLDGTISGLAGGSRALFLADDGFHGLEPWTTDGTAAGTMLLKDLNTTGADADLTAPTSFAGRLLFSADDGSHGAEPWVSDGTAAGTMLIEDLNPGYLPSNPSGGTAYPNGVGSAGVAAPMISTAGAVYFQTGPGLQLWKSDGTAAGTSLVPGVTPDSPQMGAFAGDVYLAGFDSSFNNYGLWRSDGTAAGTNLVASFPYNLAFHWLPEFTTSGSLLFFVNGPAAQVGLWRTDGTAAGTAFVTGGVLDPNLAPAGLTDVGGVLFFPKTTSGVGGVGRELWKSDGTSAGTVLVKDINPGAASSSPGNLLNVGGTLFFTANDGVHGVELWKSDGTSAGTTMVADVAPGAAGSTPTDLVAVDGTVFFTADDGIHGAELWESDGTAAGTRLVADILPGAAGSSLAHLSTRKGRSSSPPMMAATARSCGPATGPPLAR